MLACWLLLKQNQTKAFKLHRGSSIKTELWSTSFQIHRSVLGSSRRSLSLNETGHNGRSNWKMVTRLDFQVPHETCFVELAFDRSCTCPILTRKNRGFCFEMIKGDVEPPDCNGSPPRWKLKYLDDGEILGASRYPFFSAGSCQSVRQPTTKQKYKI